MDKQLSQYVKKVAEMVETNKSKKLIEAELVEVKQLRDQFLSENKIMRSNSVLNGRWQLTTKLDDKHQHNMVADIIDGDWTDQVHGTPSKHKIGLFVYNKETKEFLFRRNPVGGQFGVTFYVKLTDDYTLEGYVNERPITMKKLV